jgi:hypothetical protein
VASDTDSVVELDGAPGLTLQIGLFVQPTDLLLPRDGDDDNEENAAAEIVLREACRRSINPNV